MVSPASWAAGQPLRPSTPCAPVRAPDCARRNACPETRPRLPGGCPIRASKGTAYLLRGTSLLTGAGELSVAMVPRSLEFVQKLSREQFPVPSVQPIEKAVDGLLTS